MMVLCKKTLKYDHKSWWIMDGLYYEYEVQLNREASMCIIRYIIPILLRQRKTSTPYHSLYLRSTLKLLVIHEIED